MAKSKKVTLEKKAKAVPEFDEITPEKRVKSIKDGKVSKKKPKVKKEVLKSKGAEIVKNDPEVKKKLKGKKAPKKEDKPDDATAKAPGQAVKRDLVKLALINLRNGIKKETESNSKTSKNLFDEELRYGLNVVGIKIPVCPPHTRKIILKHSLFDDKPDVCFFISDAIPKKGDQDEAVRVFKQKLLDGGVTGTYNVMTIGQLKRDYNTHNLKMKLCNTYDVFLVESKIAEHVYSLLGKHFIVKRKRPFQVDTTNKNMKLTIENAFKKSTMKISPKSLISSFEIGTAKMDNGQIADNILSAADQLKDKWPGGWKNVSRIYLRPMQPSKISIPIYASAVNPNDVEVPVITGAKQNRLDKLQAKLKKKSEKLNLDVKTKKIGRNKVAVKKDDETVGGDKQKKKDRDEEVPKKKKGKSSEIVAETTTEQPVEKKKKKENPTAVGETISKKDKKKTQSEEKLLAVAVAEKFEKKKKNKSQDVPPTVEPEKKKKKSEAVVEEIESVVEPPKKKKKSKEPAAVVEEPAIPVKSEKKKRGKAAVEEPLPDPPKAKNKKSAAVTAEINAQAETHQTTGKKMKAKKNKT